MSVSLADKLEEIKNKERDFLFRECSRLENLGNLQLKLDEYRQVNSQLNAGQKAKEVRVSNNSEKLSNYLRAVGAYRANSHWQAHHIVAVITPLMQLHG